MPSDAPAPPPDEPWTGEPPDQEITKPGPLVGFVAPAVRTPRAGIAINGMRVDHLLIDASVNNNRHFSADTWRCTLALDESRGTKLGAAWFGSAERMEVEIFAGLDRDAPPTSSMILGRADDVDVDLDRRLIHLAGRDMTADLLEAQTTEKWPNRTSSEIARDLAGRHGLTPVVTDTSRLAGHYYKQEHAQLSDATSEWTLLTYLAEQEGFDCFVRGKELHFGPPPDPTTAPRWELRYQPAGSERPYAQALAGRLRMRRNLTLAQDITVRVVSWNAKQKRAFTVTRRREGGGGARGTRGQFTARTAYVYRLPGLTEEQAIREAERRLTDLTRLARVVEVDDLPGDPAIDVRTILALRGTGTSWDRDYQLDEIERRISQGSGFAMRFRARNLSPDSVGAGTAAL